MRLIEALELKLALLSVSLVCLREVWSIVGAGGGEIVNYKEGGNPELWRLRVTAAETPESRKTAQN